MKMNIIFISEIRDKDGKEEADMYMWEQDARKKKVDM